jgi:hypothetical protein
MSSVISRRSVGIAVNGSWMRGLLAIEAVNLVASAI